MNKMSINRAAEYFGISKEAIHNRIRRGSLEAVIENNVKMVIINPSDKSTRKTISPKAKSISSSDRYYKLLEDQNAKLSARVEVLESETRTLRDQKELMLIEEKKKIEQIYKDKDEQLKNILATLSSQFMLTTSNKESVDTLEVEVEDEDPIQKTPTSLKKYLKLSEFSDKKIAKIIKRFDKNAKNDERIILVGKKYYIDTITYDYSDLIR